MNMLYLLCALLCSLSLHAAQLPVDLVWKTSGDLAQEKEVFVKSFSKAYESFSSQDLQIETDKITFLKNAFEDEEIAFERQQKNAFFVSAYTNNQLVGFVSFDWDEEKKHVYIRQLSVDPDFWHYGIGKKLVFSIAQKVSGIQKYVLVVRRINDIAKNFYKALGFQECNFEHEGLDPKKYVGYELVVDQLAKQ